LGLLGEIEQIGQKLILTLSLGHGGTYFLLLLRTELRGTRQAGGLEGIRLQNPSTT
jgi:hypothetical protein